MIKHIVIDARLYGPKHTGLGRYTKNLLLALINTADFKKYKFTLLVYPDLINEVSTDLKDHYRYVPTPIKHYSVAEQIFLPILLTKLKPDLVHFTHLDKPLLYFGKSIVTVHDLIRHFSKGAETTTKSPWLYWPKYLGYILMTKIVFLTSSIIVPSNYWREYIIKKFNFSPDKIITTHEAVDPFFFPIPKSYILNPKPYLLYTGNLYPHKNIDVIIRALKKIPQIKLKVICARSVFTDRINRLVTQHKVGSQVQFLGYLTDSEFSSVYSNALALVHPSFIEGFSLTGLEAMALNCPVIASNATCMPEIYQDSVLYFNPRKSSELANLIKLLQKNSQMRQELIAKGRKQVKKYSWLKTANQTIEFYQKNI